MKIAQDNSIIGVSELTDDHIIMLKNRSGKTVKNMLTCISGEYKFVDLERPSNISHNRGNGRSIAEVLKPFLNNQAWDVEAFTDMKAAWLWVMRD